MSQLKPRINHTLWWWVKPIDATYALNLSAYTIGQPFRSIAVKILNCNQHYPLAIYFEN